MLDDKAAASSGYSLCIKLQSSSWTFLQVLKDDSSDQLMCLINDPHSGLWASIAGWEQVHGVQGFGLYDRALNTLNRGLWNAGGLTLMAERQKIELLDPNADFVKPESVPFAGIA